MALELGKDLTLAALTNDDLQQAIETEGIIEISQAFLMDPTYHYQIKDYLREILKIWNKCLMMKSLLSNEYAACA